MGVLLTMGWIIIGGIAHGNFLQPLRISMQILAGATFFLLYLGRAV
jgi:hypothetical protein